MKIKVLYNKSCNICNFEINHYKKLSNNKISWINIVNNKEIQKISSKNYEQLIRRIHVIKNDKVIDGAEAFLEIWKNIPKYNFLYRIFKFKLAFIFLKIFYEIIACFLFIKNKHLLKKNR